MVYNWRINKYPVSAQAAGEHLETLDREHGAVTSKIVLEDSRPEDATLHPCFEWDDSKAAEKYRLSQAGELIGNLVCVHVAQNGGEDAPSEPVRAFVSVSNGKETGTFRPTAVALSDSDMRQRVLDNAMREMMDFQRKYTMLDELAEVMAAINKVIVA